MPTDIARPFGKVAWFTPPGGTETAIGTYIQNINISTGDKGKDIRGINNATIAGRMAQVNEPSLSIEYNPQCDDELMFYVCNRDNCGHLSELTIEVGHTSCSDATADPHGANYTYYLCEGCKPSSVRISAAKNEPYTVSIDFLAKSIVTSQTATGDEPSDLTGEILAFNIAGSIAKVGGHVVDTDKIAYITDNIDINIDHQLTPYADHDSVDLSYIVEGTMDVGGSVNITLDGGGGTHFAEVLAFSEFQLTVNMGGVDCPQIVLPGCTWNNATVPFSVGGEAMMSSSPFTCIPTIGSSGIEILQYPAV
jgi:hypothetical protein